jgi:undecaprenyl-diphosphatase
MSLLQILILAIVQGLAELLPVSSSAHVVVAEKLMGLDPSSPPMTLLLVMLHTGTMFAVIVYFWRQWRSTYFQSSAAFRRFAVLVTWATVLTAAVGELLVKLIERTVLSDVPKAEVELLFNHLEFIAPALAAVGILILIAGILEHRNRNRMSSTGDLNLRQALVIGAVQGLSLPFRGFSRSGATISAGMLAGAAKSRTESFSFALAVVLTPAVVVREAVRLIHAQHGATTSSLSSVFLPSLFGAVCAFLAGLLALRWLSRWLENGRWYMFGLYCIAAAVAVEVLYRLGY